MEEISRLSTAATAGWGGGWFLPRWRCRKARVALLERLMASSGSISPFSFIIFPIQFPVRKVKSGKLWWTVPLGGAGGQESAPFQELTLDDGGGGGGT